MGMLLTMPQILLYLATCIVLVAPGHVASPIDCPTLPATHAAPLLQICTE